MTISLELLDFGYSIVPTNGRIPLVKWQEYQASKTPLVQVEAWASEFPNCGWAIVTGYYHGIVVVDADSPEAIAYCEAVLPWTPMRVITSRGKHYYYQHPKLSKIKSKRYLDDPPVDVKGDGGLCTAWGTYRKGNGHTYVLDQESDLCAPQDLPLFSRDWFPPDDPIPIPEFPSGRPTDGSPLERASRFLLKCDQAGAGTRSNAAFRVAANVVRGFGLTYEEGMPLMMAWNDRNDPPLDHVELGNIVRSALRCGSQPLGGKL